MVVPAIQEDQLELVLEIGEYQEVLLAFQEELPAHRALVQDLAFSLLEEVGWNQNQGILVEVLIPWALLGVGSLALIAG